MPWALGLEFPRKSPKRGNSPSDGGTKRRDTQNESSRGPGPADGKRPGRPLPVGPAPASRLRRGGTGDAVHLARGAPGVAEVGVHTSSPQPRSESRPPGRPGLATTATALSLIMLGDRTLARALRPQPAAACDEPGPGQHSASTRQDGATARPRRRPPGTLTPGRSPRLESKDQAGSRVWLPGPSAVARPHPPVHGDCVQPGPRQGHRSPGALPCPKPALNPEGPAGPPLHTTRTNREPVSWGWLDRTTPGPGGIGGHSLAPSRCTALVPAAHRPGETRAGGSQDTSRPFPR